MKKEIESLDSYFRRADDPIEIWDGRKAKGILANEYEYWIVLFACTSSEHLGQK